MGNTDMELLKIIAGFFFGGLAGAVFTSFVSRRRQQVEFVIKVSDKYLDVFDGLANCKACIFRLKSATDSGLNLPPIPVETCH